jgi:drug/metabolite transporter (DMT)-like permease
VAAVLLACLSALLFGAMTVALRIGLRRGLDAQAATLVTVLAAFGVALTAVAVDAARGADLRLGAAWPFALAGLLAPGGSQILFTLAVRDAGPSRTSVAVGTAPLAAVAIALLLLDEPLRAPLLVGAVLIVAGGVALVADPSRPEHVRRLGLAFAFGATILFAARDDLLRHLAVSPHATRPSVAAAATLLTGTLAAFAFARRAPGARDALKAVPAGLCFGLSYVSLFEAYYRGRVSVVSPLVATESLWGVTLSVLLLRRTELVGRRVAFGAALVVAGGALIGAFR